MKTKSSFTEIMAVLKRTAAVVPLPEYNEEQRQLWQTRAAAGEPAITIEDFPAAAAAMLLAELVLRLEKKRLEEWQARKITVEYANEQKGADCWKDYAIEPEKGLMYSHLACQTALAQMAKMISGSLGIESWGANYCPVCGGAPQFGALQGAEGKRVLVCGACLTSWRYKRIGCSFCGEEEPEQLRVVSSEAFPGWSATVCKSCKGFLKTADLREMQAEPSWQQAVLELLPLDFAVAQWAAGEQEMQ